MTLPVMPPVDPMLSKSAPSIPPGKLYEPKWDGFRAIVFRDGDSVEIGSRNTKPMQRYFPEIVEAVLSYLPERCVVDGEIIVPSSSHSGLDFDALLQRVHPAESRVRLLSVETPALLVLFDVLALGDDDLTGLPVLAAPRGAGVLGHAGWTDLDHRADRRHLDVADAVVLAVRGRGARRDRRQGPCRAATSPASGRCRRSSTSGPPTAWSPGTGRTSPGDDAVGSLLLGLYNSSGTLASVGVAASFPMARRRELVTELAPLVVPLEGHPWDYSALGRTPREAAGSRWSAGKDLSFVPLEPSLVVEVAYDHMEGERFRHTAQFRRWRPDRDPSSCTYAQLEEPVSYALKDVLATS